MATWESFPDYDAIRCPICKTEFDDANWFDYCPMCGAKLDGAINDDEKMMIETFAKWMQEYPIGWIEYAYNMTVDAFKRSPLGLGEFLLRMRTMEDLKEKGKQKTLLDNVREWDEAIEKRGYVN